MDPWSPVRRIGPPLRSFSGSEFFLSTRVRRRVMHFQKRVRIFSQGDAGKTVFYIQQGTVKLSFVNPNGKEAVLAVFGLGDFFGEGCLASQPLRMGSATAIVPTTVLIIEREEMIRALHADSDFADRFILYMLSRNIRSEENLTDQLFNPVERRLARTLLLLVGYGTQDQRQKSAENVSQEMLAEMVGTTRPRVNFFMNKFRTLGLINYNANTISVNDSLVNFVLDEL
jgi:CRP/FNR family transcriptional regulator, cyclic AMP receptor protein